MEHLDLAGVINTPTTLWNMPTFDQQDAIYLSSSRQMLEPILEETSEDEEHAQNSWHQYEHSAANFWSSAESETGSVIRIEISKDPDSISERDFACPAKRARRSDDFLIGGQLSAAAQPTSQQPTQLHSAGSYDDTVLLRRSQRSIDYNEVNSNSLERFLAYEACTRDSWGQQQQLQQRNSTGSRRFDDYSDSDSISYHSLSRSSSLIQFESLERQLLLQEQHASMSSLGNSSPSLLSFDGAHSGGALNGDEGARSGANSGSNSGNNSRRGSQSSLLKRFETSDGRLHQTYFDLDKLNFDDEQRVLFGASKANLMEATVGEVKSDSESSTTSGSSSGNSILTASKPSAEDLTDSGSTAGTRAGRIMAFQRAGKSSAENLSEDSGYCEPSTLRRVKSKSIPKNFEKFCEEEEEFQQYDYASERHTNEDVAKDIDSVPKTAQHHSKNNFNNNNNTNNNGGGGTPMVHYVVGHDICQPKINDATFIVSAATEDSEPSFNAATKPPPAPTSLPSPPPPPPTNSADEVEDNDYNVESEKYVDIEAIGARNSRCEHVKNSPTREAAMLLEQRRSLAHSPSPVSSDASSSGSSCGTARSSASVSTCASAASFTWLPTPRQLQQQLQLQFERSIQRQPAALASQLVPSAQQRSTIENFCASLRNSLPDIRDALGTISVTTETYCPLSIKRDGDVSNENGHGLEHERETSKLKEFELIATKLRNDGTAIETHILDSSDFSSPSAGDSHSDETDIEYTSVTRNRHRVYNGVDGVVEGSVGGGVVGGYVSGRRISSVPSELNKLGRKKRTSARYRYSKSSTEESAAVETSPSNSSVDEEDFFDAEASLKIRRSCSWSERRERNLQRFEAAFGSRVRERKRLATQSLGYMNASYHDLTQLDYSGERLEANQQNQCNLKRCANYSADYVDSDNMDTPKSTASTDYENVICKGNFLLDELSQIYDRNASILNDKPIAAEEYLLSAKVEDILEQPSCSPRAPPRHRKHSSSSYSDLESASVDEKVAVSPQLVPARQKNARKSTATHSLVGETQCFWSESPMANPTTVSQSKTFDQDPTNLRTSYAQSLEKCNFDPKELTNTELNKCNAIPKRRFHSQANATKQRNMVSSTPNLNAYDPRADDVENDMYVSSAHTSMHQLPQATTQKPLGILLPAGSRISISKEVSFCPVVSQYSWYEQSSEETTEQQQQQQQKCDESDKQEDTDDELLDNADATVIKNTRVNEMIAACYAPELKSANTKKSEPELRAVPIEQLRAIVFVRERQAAEESARTQEHKEEQQQEREFAASAIKTSHKSVSSDDEMKAEALKLDSSARNVAEYGDGETLITQHGTANENASHKSTFIDVATNSAKAEQAIALGNNERDDGESNRNSNFSASASELSENSVGANENVIDGHSVASGAATQARPISIHLPILSEPPTNRAHHILYASQQLLDNFERRESAQYYYQNNSNTSESAIAGSAVDAVPVEDRRAKSVGNLSAAQQTTPHRMANAAVGAGGQSGSDATAVNNNNELMNKKFKDEKHPSSKGFLSRFAHGLRFSLRRKNKKQQQQQQNDEQNSLSAHVDKTMMKKSFGKSATLPQQQQQQLQQLTPVPMSTSPKSKTTDYIYIPLKGPIPPAGTQPPNTTTKSCSPATLPSNFSHADAQIGANNQQALLPTNNTINTSKCNNDDKNAMSAITNGNGEPLVTGKPPKPYRFIPIPTTNSSATVMTKFFGSGRRQGSGPASAHKDGNGMPNATNFKSRSQFYTNFLNAERSHYDEDENGKQLDADMQANGIAGITSNKTATTVSGVNVTEQQQQQQLQEHAIIRGAENLGEKRDYSQEFEIQSNSHDTSHSSYPLSDVNYESVMFLTGPSGSGVAVGANNDSTAGIICANARVVPTYTTMSNAYLQHTNNNNKVGLIETNLDTHETVISGKTRSLVDIAVPQQHEQQYVVVGDAKCLNMSAPGDGKTDFDLDIDEDEDAVHIYGHDIVGRGGVVAVKTTTANGSQIASVRRPHKSMEFLLDKENQKNVLPPENELQKSHDHNPAALSEHQLRVQASLQRLNIPDWFRQYNQNTSRSPEGNPTVYKPGNFTRKRTTESGRWAGLNSKTTSLSSLGSQRSDRSPLLLSPSAHSHHGGQASQQHGVGGGTGVYATGGGAGAFSRWSTSHLNSSQTSPSVSQRGSFTRGGPINSSFMSVASGQSNVTRSSYRQPYLGWRSQEKLSQRTPHERLASSLLAQQQRTPNAPRTVSAPNGDNNGKLLPVTPEIQSSIKEVTSAIVHYVNDQTQQQQRSRSASPNSRKCWLESSFVGIRPLDSPQTPVIENTATAFESAATNTNNSNSSQYNAYNYSYNTSNSSANTLTAITTPNSVGGIGGVGGIGIGTAITTNPHVLRMNGLSIVGGGESTIMI